MNEEFPYNPDTDGTFPGTKPQDHLPYSLRPDPNLQTMSDAISQFPTAVIERKQDTRAEIGSLAMSREEMDALPPSGITVDCMSRDDGTGRSSASKRETFRLDSLN